MEKLRERIPYVAKRVKYDRREIFIGPPDAEKIAHGWLTESGIEYFLAEVALNHKHRGLRYIVFPTDFYQMLVRNRPKPDVYNFPEYINTSLQLADFPRMQDPRRMRIVDQHVVLLPMNIRGDHWILVVLCNLATDNAPVNGEPVSILFFFDSDQSRSSDEATESVADELRAYFNCVYFFRKQEKIRFTAENCPCIRMNVPQQANNNDCGLHVIQTARAMIPALSDFFNKCKANRANVGSMRDFVVNDVNVGEDTRRELLEAIVPIRG